MTTFYDDDHEAFRETVRTFVDREVRPSMEDWDRDGLIPRDVWRAAGKAGVLGLRIPEEHGGAGVDDYRFRCVVQEELAQVGAASFASGTSINDDVVVGYLRRYGTPEQQATWLPGMATGDVVASIAMSEPGAGSDLRGMRTTAVREGDTWRLSGAKTFITSGFSSDVVLVAARTSEHEGRPRLSLFVVPSASEGFSRGRKLSKVGLHAQDTAELAFDDLVLPTSALLGEEGSGFHHLTHQLPLERLSIAWRALVAAEAAYAWTVEYTKERQAFGSRVIDFQSSRFRLAELSTELDVTRAFMEQAVLRLGAGELDATTGAKAKWW